MVFPYELYVRVNLHEPLLLLLFHLFYTLLVVVEIIWVFKRSPAVNVKSLAISVLAVIVGIIFLCIDANILSQGGMYLLAETEEEAVTACGYIESIEEHYEVSVLKYPYQGSTELGYDICIDGESYIVISSTDYTVGDYVEFTYLPLSRFVLSMNQNE